MSKEIKTVEMDEETTQETLRTYENDILGGLLAAAGFAEDESETETIEIRRNGVTYLRFKIRPLSEEEYEKCRELHTHYVKSKRLGGIRIPESTDNAKYRSELIYTATVAEDREKIWDNKAAWAKLDVMSGRELIGRVLKPGEKDAIIDRLDEISGYSSLEEVAKN